MLKVEIIKNLIILFLIFGTLINAYIVFEIYVEKKFLELGKYLRDKNEECLGTCEVCDCNKMKK